MATPSETAENLMVIGIGGAIALKTLDYAMYPPRRRSYRRSRSVWDL